jgi:hypothetical protein
MWHLILARKLAKVIDVMRNTGVGFEHPASPTPVRIGERNEDETNLFGVDGSLRDGGYDGSGSRLSTGGCKRKRP